jgi:hypothetical protein
MDEDGTQPVSEATRLAAKSTAAFEDAVTADTRGEQDAKLAAARVAAGDSALAGAYTFLQKLVGLIAVSLPFVLAIGNVLLGGDELEGSISHHYYTAMGNVFVGALCALGVFFLSYQHKPLPGYRLDNRVSYGASAAAIGVALFPTAEHEATAWTGEWYLSTAHLVCACALFLLLAFFSVHLFRKTDPAYPVTANKRRRNVVHATCGWTIVASIGLVVVTNIAHAPDSWKVLFWLESLGVVAFGISWLVKSGIFGLLVDEVPVAAPAPDAPGRPAPVPAAG